MTPLTLSYGTFTFPVFPALVIERTQLREGEIGSNEGSGTRERWRVAGVVRGATPQALETARQGAETALSAPGLALKLASGGTALREVAGASCRIAPQLVSLEWDASDPSAFHGESRFTAVFEAVLLDNNLTVQSLALRITQATDAAGRLTVTTEGAATLKPGVGDEPAIAALTPALPADMRRVETRFVFRPESRVELRIVDEAEFRALPGGVRDGHFVRALGRDSQGRLIETITGFFVGERAVQRAWELRPPRRRLLDEHVAENPFERRADFRFSALAPTGSTAAHRVEQVTLIEKRQVVDHRPKARGAPVYRQETGSPEYRVVQEGTAIAAGIHPSPAAPLFPADLVEREVRYVLPPPDKREAPLETRWRYVSAPLGALSFAAPR